MARRLTRAAFKKPPFRIDEKGWGEFDMTIVLTAVHKGGEHTLKHDLNFQSEQYESKHTVVSAAHLYWGDAQLTSMLGRLSGILDQNL